MGGNCSITLATGDKMGNACAEGGGKLTCDCEHAPTIDARVSDHGDGTYSIAWHGQKTGTYSVGVLIDGAPVVGSPATLMLSSSVCDLTRCA